MRIQKKVTTRPNKYFYKKKRKENAVHYLCHLTEWVTNKSWKTSNDVVLRKKSLMMILIISVIQRNNVCFACLTQKRTFIFDSSLQLKTDLRTLLLTKWT